MLCCMGGSVAVGTKGFLGVGVGPHTDENIDVDHCLYTYIHRI